MLPSLEMDVPANTHRTIFLSFAFTSAMFLTLNLPQKDVPDGDTLLSLVDLDVPDRELDILMFWTNIYLLNVPEGYLAQLSSKYR